MNFKIFTCLFMIFCLTWISGCKNNIEVKTTKKELSISANALKTVELFKEEIESKIDDSIISEEDSTLYEIKLDDTKKGNEKAKERGNVYIFWGNLSEELAQHEWNEFFMITRYLSKRGYTIFLNPYAKVSDLNSALHDIKAEMITWSSHGNGGLLHDKNLNQLPFDIFNVENPSIKQIIISACDGELIRNNYVFNSNQKVITWLGTTNADEFINYFNTDAWLIDFN